MTLKNTSYAVRKECREDGSKTTILMHAVIMNELPLGYERDHKDGNGLNNQKDNLRFLTHRQNMQNRHDTKTSKFPGVYWNKKTGKWMSRIQVDGIRIFLGLHADETNAFAAYRRAVENIGQTVVETT